MISRIRHYIRCFNRIFLLSINVVYLGRLRTIGQYTVLASDVDEGDLLSDGFILEHGCEGQVTLSLIGVPTVFCIDKLSQSFIGILTLVGSDSTIRSSDTPAFEYLTGNRSNVLGGRRYNRLSRRKLNSIHQPYRRTVVRIQERNQNLLLRPLRDVLSIASYLSRRCGLPTTKDVAFTSGITAVIECRRFFIYQQVPMNLILEDFLVVYAIGVGDGVLGLLVIRLIVVVLVFRPDGIERGILINTEITSNNPSSFLSRLRCNDISRLCFAETNESGQILLKALSICNIDQVMLNVSGTLR